MRISDSELDTIEGVLGYNFEERSVLVEPLIHGSVQGAVNEKFTYERLEFLGDAVLDLLAVLYFLRRNQQMREVDLRKKVSDSTNNTAFGSLCIELNYYKYLQHRGLESHIVNGEQAFLTKKPKPTPCHWRRLSISKVCFVNLIESTFGTVFVDSGFDIETPWRL